MEMLEIIDSLLLKNRTIVSSDNRACLELIGREIPLTVHRFGSGEDFATWPIPPKWDVIKATLSDGDKIIASYSDHPLFLAPYSQSFSGWVSRDELKEHVRTKPEDPEVYAYEYRLAYDYRRRLNEWAISLPHQLVALLDKEKYFVDIQVETGAGEMLVGESLIQGRNDCTMAFLTHLCHPGQANDGLAGVAVGIELMKRLAQEFSATNYNYQLLITPETIGSVAYLAANVERIDSYLGSVFIEMAGIDSPLRLGLTRSGDTYLDRVLREAFRRNGAGFSEAAFDGHWGNDELIFDSPGTLIPGAAIERYPFGAYHTSADNMDATSAAALEEIVELLMEAVRIIESDYIPVPRQRLPVYLTRYSLYADWENERTEYDLNEAIIRLLWSGMSVFDIANHVGAPFESVRAYITRFAEEKLIDMDLLTPAYFRSRVDDE